ncbi:XapX domain-containing protein [Pseudomonas aeruginosa]|uniref:XapX domain-containing protein n=1 Tax=Pseudomonas aeruginosa TaxID=287 RepID=UPI0021F18A92|nr:XapX domain-containing protein [Pseudomonas aeruginosa]MCV4154189.1 XapX domain-containing protein [Pseudomonas aeruginosa]
MNYVISLGIGLLVGVLYAALDFRSPAPPAIALVGLLGMQLGEQLFPLGRTLLQQWLH